jgi:hypothetical protein
MSTNQTNFSLKTRNTVAWLLDLLHLPPYFLLRICRYYCSIELQEEVSRSMSEICYLHILSLGKYSMDSFDILPNDCIKLIISYYPKRCWFVLNKRISALACHEIDPSLKKNWAIRYGAREGFYKLVDRLIKDSRVFAGAAKNHAIRMAAQRGHEDIVQRLLEDPGGNYGHEIVLDILLQHCSRRSVIVNRFESYIFVLNTIDLPLCSGSKCL